MKTKIKFEDFRDTKFVRLIRDFDAFLISYHDIPKMITELTRLQKAITEKKEYLTLDSLEKKVEKRVRLMNNGE